MIFVIGFSCQISSVSETLTIRFILTVPTKSYLDFHYSDDILVAFDTLRKMIKFPLKTQTWRQTQVAKCISLKDFTSNWSSDSLLIGLKLDFIK